MPVLVQPAIPASQIVDVLPSVLPAGGNALDLIGLILTQNTRVPIGTILSFVDETDVGGYFGPTSNLAGLATIYFNGPNNATKLPGSLWIAQYPESAVAAYLRGGNISGLPLAVLQGYSGLLSIVINGTTYSGAPNLMSATSFSNAATIVGDVLAIPGAEQSSAVASIEGTAMTVSSIVSGTLAPGQLVQGTGATAGTYIVSQLSGTTGGVGVYQVAPSQNNGSETVALLGVGIAYDSVSGAFVVTSTATGTGSTIAFATGALSSLLLLTQATGATLSQGVAATTPGAFMPTIIAQTQNWAEFMTDWEPTDTEKEEFATWVNGTNNRYVYEMWTTNVLNTEAGGPSAPVAFVNNGNLTGISMIHENPLAESIPGTIAAFEMSWTASLDFNRTNGRQTAAFKSQTGLPPQVKNGTITNYLLGYGLNFYGDYSTPNQAFIWYYNGSISGPFLWKDSYVNQIWLSNALQLALMELLQNVGSIPYNAAGYAMIDAAVLDPINAAVNFGAIRAGVPLSAAQIVEVNNAAGVPIDAILSSRGWYFQVQPASPQVRAARGSPPCTLWYMDGQSIQAVVLASIEVQ